VAQDGDTWRSAVNTAINIHFLHNVESLSNS
jgi:hypothetical protein